MATKQRISAEARKRSATRNRKRIFRVLTAASAESDIDVTAASALLKTISVQAKPGREHTAKVKLIWSDAGRPHYRGHFIDNDGDESQAILSLYSPFDAAQFVVAMNLLADLSAKTPH